MSINLHVLKATGRLNEISSQVRSEFNDAVGKICKAIPLSDVDVVIYENPQNTIPEFGIGGFTPSSHLVFIYINPAFTSIKDSINQQLKRTLAHELYHALRWKNPGYGKTLLEALITEGLADHFDMEINNCPPQLWDKALTGKQFGKMSAWAKKEYHNRNYLHNDWFFGSKNRGIPKWTGYSLGFRLVGDYLKKYPSKKPSKLYNVKAEEFI